MNKLGTLSTPCVLAVEAVQDRHGIPVLAVLYALVEDEEAVSRKTVVLN